MDGELVVCCDDPPLSVNEEADSVVVSRVDVEEEEGLQQLGVGVGQGTKGADEVAVAGATLPNVVQTHRL